jgi:hypothetical protein
MDTKHYMAAPILRSVRQAKLNYLPIGCVIGSHDFGNGVFSDIIMLPAKEFIRMKTYAGMSHNLTLSMTPGEKMNSGYALHDIKEVTVPESEPDPEAYAREVFLAAFKVRST